MDRPRTLAQLYRHFGAVDAERVEQQDRRPLAAPVQHRCGQRAHRRPPSGTRVAGSVDPPGTGVRATFMTMARVV